MRGRYHGRQRIASLKIDPRNQRRRASRVGVCLFSTFYAIFLDPFNIPQIDISDALDNPRAVLKALYGAGGSDSFPELAAQAFKKAFSSLEEISKIPSVENSSLELDTSTALNRPYELVRFRGMIQSTDSEVYQSTLSDGSLAGWGIGYEEEDWNQMHVWNESLPLDDRSTAWAVSVPGETEWVTQELVGSQRPERSSPFPSKFPIFDRHQTGLVLKLYGDPSNSPKLTEVLNFIGVLTSEPYASVDLEGNHHETPTPTLHVIFSVPSSPTLKQYTFPMPDSAVLLPPNGEVPTLLQTHRETPRQQAIRDALINWIAKEGLGGDIEAATWVLLASISRTYSRTPLALPLSITLAHFPNPPPRPTSDHTVVPAPLEPTLLHLLKLLLPAVVYVPLSIDFLNKTRLAPTFKDEDLESGVLQLASGTTVLVSDSGIAEGVLNESGVRNIDTLRKCIFNQTLAYRYPYSEFNMNTSLNFIIVAQGKSSPFAETQTIVPVRPESAFSLYKGKDQISLPPKEVLELFRAFIGGARIGKAAIHEDISEHLQNDFVKERQLDQSVSSDDLILWMSIARWTALSLHRSEITRDIWDSAKQLNKSRLQRVRNNSGFA